MNRIIGLLLLIFAVVFAPVGAEADNFNDVLPGARAMGMGRAYTAVAEGPDAMYYNPAGLAGSEFPEIEGSVGRMMSPVGPLAFEDFAYTRPFSLRPGGTVGAAYFNERQENGGDKDEMLFHYSEPVSLSDYYFTKPVKLGANVKILSLDLPGGGSKFGLGLDGGVLFESNFGLKTGISIQNLAPNLGVADPWITLGNAYMINNRVTLSGDLKIRRGLTEFFPGVEVSFFEGLLMARAGKGLPLDQVDTVAMGAGINFSPLVLDFAMSVPFFGMTRPGGAYEMSLSYKFGAPSFSGRFVGMAAREAEELKAELLELEDKKNTLESEVATDETNKTAAESELRAYNERMQTLQDELRKTQRKLDEITYQIQQPKPPEAPKPTARRVPRVPASPAFPRYYTVVAGDTLRSIAKEQYGDPNLWELIYDANRDKTERGLPLEGAKLLLPAPPSGH